MNLDSSLLEKLKQSAKEVSQNAYAPYSDFPVGCAVLTASEKIYTGCNVENASYGLTICAERAAVFNAVSAGDLKRGELRAVVVYTPTPKPTSPCGACRQVISEFANEDTTIFAFCDSEQILQTTAKEMLPSAFIFPS